ncbi:MAG: sel1 repeat family protein [Pseudomonadota bacterium]
MKNLTSLIAIASVLVGAAAPALAEEVDDGFLNPQNGTIEFFVRKLDAGIVDPMGAIYGYAAAKAGDNETARRIFQVYAERGNTQAMTWMSWLEDNGLGGPENPEAAAEWDRRAMAAGDHIGTYNYGLDLLRGRGVARDEVVGRQMIDKAAAMGDKTAQTLKDADYDLDVVTPDADNWKYNPYIY